MLQYDQTRSFQQGGSAQFVISIVKENLFEHNCHYLLRPSENSNMSQRCSLTQSALIAIVIRLKYRVSTRPLPSTHFWMLAKRTIFAAKGCLPSKSSWFPREKLVHELAGSPELAVNLAAIILQNYRN